MEMIKKVLNKIAYIFICINQDIKMRYEIQKEIEDGMSATDILDRALALMRDEMEHSE